MTLFVWTLRSKAVIRIYTSYKIMPNAYKSYSYTIIIKRRCLMFRLPDFGIVDQHFSGFPSATAVIYGSSKL